MRTISRTISLLATALALASPAAAGEEKLLVGSYRWVKRVLPGGGELKPPEIVGFMTFSKTHRSLNARWTGPAGEPVSLSLVSAYTVESGRYCETPLYWMQNNLDAPGVAYDWPAAKAACSALGRDASGTSFDVPGEQVRFRVSRDGIIGSSHGRFDDHWERVK